METSLAEHVGFEIAREMAENWRAASTCPKVTRCNCTAAMNRWDDFDGHNHNQLAAKYKISVQWVYTIVKRMRASKFRKMQIGLFDQINTQQPKE
ncbi:MAG: hypothetical protein IPJ05_02705 [Nitrosomonas sp.]|nr:hypothetical protein [Nitrosomonas sp.]